MEMVAIAALIAAAAFGVGFAVARALGSATVAASSAREGGLTGRVAGLQQELDRVRSDTVTSQNANAELRSAVVAATEARARAEGGAARVAGLEDQIGQRDRALADLTGRVADLRVSLAETQESLKSEREQAASKLALLRDAESQLREAFKAAAADSLKANGETFFQMAHDKFESASRKAADEFEAKKLAIESIVDPLRKSLASFDEQNRSLEKDRGNKLASLEEQLRQLSETHLRLSNETDALVSALRQPHVRGQWGQMTLRRVMEIAGMSEHCDFEEQVSVSGDEGSLRPDVVVHLSDSRDVIVDAKVPLAAYLDAVQASSEGERSAARTRHASQARTHIQHLAEKAYVAAFPNAFDRVVMFVPNDAVWNEACAVDPEIQEFAMRNKVIVATPMTLLVVLSAVAQAWQQEQLAKSAAEVSSQARLLFDRMQTFVDHVRTLGQRLKSSVDAYNSVVGSLEGRLLPVVRRFPELGAVPRQSEIESLVVIEVTPREVIASLSGAGDGSAGDLSANDDQ